MKEEVENEEYQDDYFDDSDFDYDEVPEFEIGTLGVPVMKLPSLW